MNEEKMIILPMPLETKSGEQITEIHLREPTVYEVIEASGFVRTNELEMSILDSQADLLRRISGLTLQEVNKLPVRVSDEAVRYLVSFETEARRKHGDPPSEDPTFSIVLDPPIKARNSEYDVIHLREPTVQDRKNSEAKKRGRTLKGVYEAEVQLVQDVSGLPIAAVLALPISVFVKAADYLTGFFMAGPETGAPSLMS